MKSSRRALRVSGTVALFALAYAGAWLAYRWLAPPYARLVAHTTEQIWAVTTWSCESPRLEVVEGEFDGRPAVAMVIERPGIHREGRACAVAARLLFSNLPAVLALLLAFPDWSLRRVRWGLRALCWLFLFHILAVRIEVAYLEGTGFCGSTAMAAADAPGLLLRAAHSLSYRLASGPEAVLGLLVMAAGVTLLERFPRSAVACSPALRAGGVPGPALEAAGPPGRARHRRASDPPPRSRPGPLRVKETGCPHQELDMVRRARELSLPPPHHLAVTLSL